MKQPAVFLDRDGTLIEEVNYLSRVKDLKLFPYTAKAIRLLKDHGFLVIVVTNQSGIGRGEFEETAMHSIHDQIQVELSGAIDGFYFCPHLPDAGCKCRKPGTGMIDEACGDFEVEISKSWLVGDKEIDVGAGQNAQMSTILVRTGYGNEHANSLRVRPEYIEADLLAAVYRIIG
ncbi:D-glycero-beta-D-manno-heptose 1,7-bisphosphate 7-phosphatase [soil metagenome]